MTKNSRLVYSTEKGRITPSELEKTAPKGDGIVRIRRETSGRKGKGVTTITGLELSPSELNNLAKQLKQLCSTGGTVKDFVIEIQGDHRDKVKTKLESLGYTAKLAGG